MNHDENCLFCKIIAGKIPSDKIYEDDSVFAFRDINPRAPVHILLIPKKHIPDLNSCTDDDRELLADILRAAPKVAELAGIKTSGYRVITNNGPDSGQEVFHIHFHIVGGRKLTFDM